MNDKVLSLDLDDPNQLSEKESGPVECLGKTFENDQARRDYYLAILAEKLKDPEFRKIEGFPIGEDEDILNLSDPPYYTACPNPFLEDFISFYGRPYDPNEEYKREPYAADVSEGKSDPIYNVHSYHTKVPYKAIMHYILHYTNPGDIVFDGFCGSGMTGIAAQMCGNKKIVESIGYKVDLDNTIFRAEKNDVTEGVKWIPFSKLGVRKAILNDLSPAATFIAGNLNTSTDIKKLNKEFETILSSTQDSVGWMYKTHHEGKLIGNINYVVWSDVYLCCECGNEIIYWDSAIDTQNAEVNTDFSCLSCNAINSKTKSNHAKITRFDRKTNEIYKISKQIPVIIIYSVNGLKGRFEKKPDDYDLELLSKIENINPELWFPVYELHDGYNTRQPIRSHGFNRVNKMYTDRNLLSLSYIWSKAKNNKLKFLFTGFVNGATKLNQFHLKNYVFGGGGFNPGPRKGTLYAPSISMEASVISLLKDRYKTQTRAYELYNKLAEKNVLISTASCSNLNTTSYEILDYIFIDPPFGANLNYSELSIFWESWLKVMTNNREEAIENPIQNKGPDEYRAIMVSCFKEAFRMLKPGRWMTVEFSNTKSTVWNNLQTSLTEAGFIVGNVSALDKKQGGINSNISGTAVKQDLVISAYKPNDKFNETFVNASNVDGVWHFLETHLQYLPVVKRDQGSINQIRDRDPRILYDQVVAYFVRNMRDVPLSSKEFQNGLIERFSERDGMIFLPEQVAQYDKARMSSTKLRQLSIFVHDEASAIDWLRQLLMDKPQTYQDIQPKFMSELAGWKKAEIQLELIKLLEQNFLKFNGQGLVPAQIHSYLSTNFKELRGLEKDDPELLAKAKDRWFVPDPNNEEQLQALRERDLLKQFEEYKTFSGKKIKQVRMEAVRAGFKKAWKDRDYETIIHIAEKIPESLLQEDEKLLMWYDQAKTRHGNTGFF